MPSQQKHRNVDPVKVPRAIDLFCGAGGLSRGLLEAGFAVVGGIENDALAAETYRLNFPDTKLWDVDIREVSSAEVMRELDLEAGDLDLLAGCPPCEGFSTLRTRNGHKRNRDPLNQLVSQFQRLTLDLRPKAVMLENVPALEHNYRFKDFVRKLHAAGYTVHYRVKNVADYGVPQKRRRLILMATRDDAVTFPELPPIAERRTVRQALAGLTAAGQSGDPLHDHGERRSPQVQAMIRNIPKDGGSRSALPKNQVLPCHQKFSGFRDVYGRMAWDRPAPTITGGCVNPSKGRFLHPSEDRAITLREAALLQSFPADHAFSLSRGKFAVAEMIGNALPPAFVQAHAERIRQALEDPRAAA